MSFCPKTAMTEVGNGALITKSRPRHVAAAPDVDSAITRNTQHTTQRDRGRGRGRGPGSFFCATERLDRGFVGLLASANRVSFENREAVNVEGFSVRREKRPYISHSLSTPQRKVEQRLCPNVRSRSRTRTSLFPFPSFPLQPPND